MSNLSNMQAAFLATLANISVGEPYLVSEIVKLVSVVYGMELPKEDALKQLIDTLVETGYVLSSPATIKEDIHSFAVTPTEQFVKARVWPSLERLKTQKHTQLFSVMLHTLAEILFEAESKNQQVAKLALEAIAFKLMRILDMTYIATHRPTHAATEAQVDLVFQSDRLAISRWQFYCTKASVVSLDDVATRVGLTYSLRGSIIAIVSTGTISREAHHYASRVVKAMPIHIVFADRSDLSRIAAQPTHLLTVVSRTGPSLLCHRANILFPVSSYD